MTADRQHFDYIWGDGLTLEADIDKPSQVEIEAGWDEGKPKRATANWVENRQDEMLAHIEQNGAPRWDSSTSYANGAICIGSDNKLYQAQQSSTNQNPTTAGVSYWKVIGADSLAKSENLNDLANKGTARTNLDVYSKSEVDALVTTGSTDAITKDIEQASHGFSVGTVVYDNGGVYVKAINTGLQYEAQAAGIVSAVADSSHFTLTVQGFISGLSLTSNQTYYVGSTAGVLTSTKPTTVGQYIKPVLTTWGYDGSSGYVQISADILQVTSATSLQVSNNLSDVASVSTARSNLSVYSKAEVDAKGSTITKLINHSSHSFTVGNVMYYYGSGYYQKSQCDGTEAEATAVGIVSAVPNSDQYVITLQGYISGLSGLTAGKIYYVSATPGVLTDTKPSTAGQYVKPVLVATSSTEGYIQISAETEVVASGGSYLTTTNNLSDLTDASAARTNLGLGSIATQASNNVSITGGSILGITRGAFCATLGANQTITTGNAQVIQAGSESVDQNSWYDTSTYRYTPQSSGVYFIYARATISDLAATEDMYVYVSKNTTYLSTPFQTSAKTGYVSSVTYALVSMNGSTDYIEFKIAHNSSSDRTLRAANRYTEIGGWAI